MWLLKIDYYYLKFKSVFKLQNKVLSRYWL
jgi:hypothetical protein